MSKYKYLCFDLDGTLTDSYQGIKNCIDNVFRRHGFVLKEDKFREFVGPPLNTSFKCYFPDDEDREGAIAEFREIYHQGGIFENEVYDGVLETLVELKSKGFKLFVATSKQETVAKTVLDHFGLSGYFDGIFGARIDLNVREKEEVLARILTQENDDLGKFLMIGDTAYDVEGALFVGIDCLFCEYGYGRSEEIFAKNIVKRVKNIREVTKFLEKAL